MGQDQNLSLVIDCYLLIFWRILDLVSHLISYSFLWSFIILVQCFTNVNIHFAIPMWDQVSYPLIKQKIGSWYIFGCSYVVLCGWRSAGGTFVEICVVMRLARKNLKHSYYQYLPSIFAFCIILVNGGVKFSASAFPYGQHNVIFFFSFFFSICLDVPHLTNEHRTQDGIASWRGQFCILPV